MVGRGYRQTLRETREDNRTRTPQGGGTRSALYGLSHAAGYGIGDETDSGTAEVVSESLPKIVFYEEFIENRDWFKSTRIADELGISPRQLHQFLAEEGICKYEKRQWVVLSFLPGLAMRCALHVGEQSRGQGYILSDPPNDGRQAGRECSHRTVAQEEP